MRFGWAITCSTVWARARPPVRDAGLRRTASPGIAAGHVGTGLQVATRAERLVVNAAGAAEGIVLVTVPAASTIFTNPSRYDLSSTQYGALFIPQAIAAIATSLLGSQLMRRLGAKPLYLIGLALGLAAMTFVLLSQVFMSTKGVAYALLLVATTLIGAGFGLAVPTLNSLTAAFNPGTVDSAVLVLNALLGLGTVLA